MMMLNKTNGWKTAVAAVLIASRFGLPLTSMAQENIPPLRADTGSLKYKIEMMKKPREEVKKGLRMEIQKIDRAADSLSQERDSLMAIGEEAGYTKSEIDPKEAWKSWDYVILIGLSLLLVTLIAIKVRFNKIDSKMNRGDD